MRHRAATSVLLPASDVHPCTMSFVVIGTDPL
jgi:hypothetical protein